MDTWQHLANRTGIDPKKIRDTVGLLDDGNTIPFIARYRKEVTGNLNEEQIALIKEEVDRQRSLDGRRTTIFHTIEKLGLLTESLKQQILNTQNRTELEDLYQPYKPKRKTKASIARTNGLEPLANIIFDQPVNPIQGRELAKTLISADFPDVDAVFRGARDILAENISDHHQIRTRVRKKGAQFGRMTSVLIDQEKDTTQVYKTYYQFSGRIDRLKPYQVLAINRGEAEKVLQVKITIEDRDWRPIIYDYFSLNRQSPFANDMIEAVEDGAIRLLLPAIERDLRRELTTQAENHAIQVFAANTRNLLMQPPITGRVVLGIDPGLRTGCKLAVIDSTGKVLETGTIFPHEPRKEWEHSILTIQNLISEYGASLIAVGNGTASRETEKLIIEVLGKYDQLHYLIVSEAGASVYSASATARKELPDIDVSIRGAVSIARRVLDPLAELVKVDPKSIGVGMYQHDVNQRELSKALDRVVESVVNQVGVDVNTASVSLLTYIAGVGPTLAEKFVEFRDTYGPFKNRLSLLSIPGLGSKTFQQAAGFLRILNGENPLDQTAIHPESYHLAFSIMNLAETDLMANPLERKVAIQKLIEQRTLEDIASTYNAGLPTITDIVEQILRPGRDPRSEIPSPILRRDVFSMDDLSVGMRIYGTVRNVVDFGAFIDLGVKQDGLLHRSKIPMEMVLRVGDIVQVTILVIDKQRGRISLDFVG